MRLKSRHLIRASADVKHPMWPLETIESRTYFGELLLRFDWCVGPPVWRALDGVPREVTDELDHADAALSLLEECGGEVDPVLYASRRPGIHVLDRAYRRHHRCLRTFLGSSVEGGTHCHDVP